MAELSVWRLAYGHVAQLAETMMMRGVGTSGAEGPQSMDTASEDVTMTTGGRDGSSLMAVDPVGYLGDHVVEALGELGYHPGEGGVDDLGGAWSVSTEALTDLHDHSGAGGREARAQEAAGPGGDQRIPLIGDLIGNLDDWSSTASAPPSPHRGRSQAAGRAGPHGRRRDRGQPVPPSYEDVRRWRRLRDLCEPGVGSGAASGHDTVHGCCPPPAATPRPPPGAAPNTARPHPAFPTHPNLHISHGFTTLLAAASAPQRACQAPPTGIEPHLHTPPTTPPGASPSCANSVFDREGLGRLLSEPDFVSAVQNELVATFDVLTNNFYYEVFLWIYINVTLHPRSETTRTRLQYLGLLGDQTMHDVLLNLLLGYFNGFHQGRASLLQEIRAVLTNVYDNRNGHIDPDQLGLVRELSVELGIHLNPRQMLRTFSTVVRDIILGRIPFGNSSCPATRRRTRERHMLHPSESPERRAFQPPPMAARQLHPAVLPHNTHPHMTSHHHMTSHPIVIDVEQGPVSNPVTVTPYGVPVCSGPHHIPICTGAHVPMCSTQPTWSIPACSMPIPSCSIQHLPTCSLQSIPVPHATMAPIINSHPHPSHHSHMTHHVAQPSQFVPTPPPVQVSHQEEDVQIIGEHRVGAPPRHYLNPAVAHQHHQHTHHPAPLTPSPPVLLQEPTVHPTPHELYNPFSRYRRTPASRNRWRSIPPPPPPYPGFLLHFLAMLGNPPMPHYGMDLSDDATEVENYERHLLSSPHQALLNLAERLGEAKPRGLSKGDIDQLPHYRYSADINQSPIDQTSCVVCMCDFENRQILRILPCSHEFHAKCVDKWLKTNRTCPICRADASGGLSQSE